MPMGKVIVYIATSLDGYVAGKDDDISWLEHFNVPGEDYGFSEFIQNVGTAVMGARTYDQMLKHPERMLIGIKNYVLNDMPMTVLEGVDVEFYGGDLTALVEKIKKESDKDIFIVGGGQVVSSFLNADLVDELIHFVTPILLGGGISLYSALDKLIDLQLVETQSYETGLVKLRYALKS